MSRHFTSAVSPESMPPTDSVPPVGQAIGLEHREVMMSVTDFGLNNRASCLQVGKPLMVVSSLRVIHTWSATDRTPPWTMVSSRPAGWL
jgi:hypothetical protein